MARVHAVPINIWNRLHTLYVIRQKAFLSSHSPRADFFSDFSDFDSQDSSSHAVLIGRKEKAIEEAELIGSNVWDFVVGPQWKASQSSKTKADRPMMDHYFIIAKDEEELESRVAVMEIMSV